MNYIPIQCKSHYSLLRSTNQSADLLEYAQKAKLSALAVTDYGTISGCVNVFKTLKAGGIKPILGTTLYICPFDSTNKQKENSKCGYLTLIARNLDGWRELIKITSYANDPIRWDGHPRLSLSELLSFSLQNLICLNGGVGSIMANAIFKDSTTAYNSTDIGIVEGQVNYFDNANFGDILYSLKESFGDNFYIESQLNDHVSRPVQSVLHRYWKNLNIKMVASSNAHYIEPEDSYDQRVLLCSKMKTTFGEVNNTVANFDDNNYGAFFLSNKYCLNQELPNEEKELKNTWEIAEKCEAYDILSKPMLPKFNCPGELSPEEYLRQICREGWVKRIAKRIPKESQPIYAERIKSELEVLQGAGLSTYFLLLNDVLSWCRNEGYLVGPARGSSAGSLTAYLSEITAVDPIKHKLIFSRFYNEGRNTKDRIAMPDIDFDIPSSVRGNVLRYIAEKYGQENVSQMITYQNFKGRSSIKEVLRVYGNTPNELMNQISEPIPDEAKISDELQEMFEEEGESSIIKWALENKAKQLESWCKIEEDGTLSGPLSKRFEQAMRLEGLKKSQGRHPAGVVVSPIPLNTVAPLIYDKEDDCVIIGYEMGDAEACGLTKFDVLAVSVLDKIQNCSNSIYEDNVY